MEFDHLYARLSDRQKLDFLAFALQEKPELKDELKYYFRDLPFQAAAWQANTVDSYMQTLEQEIPRLQSTLEAIDFDDIDWGRYKAPSDRYVPEYEAHDRVVEEMAEEFVDQAYDEALTTIDKGDAGRGMMQVLALRIAIHAADLDSEGWGNEHLRYTLQNAFKYRLREAIPFITNSVRSDGERTLLSEMMVRGLVRYENGPDARDEWDERGAVGLFEQLLETLLASKGVAVSLLQQFAKAEVNLESLPTYRLALLRVAEDEEAWIKVAESSWDKTTELAIQVLEYHKSRDRNLFVQWAELAFEKFNHRISAYLCESLSPDTEPDFWKRIMTFQISQEHKIERYQQLRPYLDPKEKQAILDTLNSGHELFRMQIYDCEGRKDLIVKHLEKDPSSWRFDEILPMIQADYPDRAYDLTRERVLSMMVSKSGRGYYAQIAAYLKTMLTHTPRRAETVSLIMQVYNRKPALPALRDEMRKAGLVG